MRDKKPQTLKGKLEPRAAANRVRLSSCGAQAVR